MASKSDEMLDELYRARGLLVVITTAMEGPNNIEKELPYALEELYNRVDNAIQIGEQAAQDAAKVFAGDVPVVGYAENDSGTK